ncbi:hypothetical protein X975_19595, partial [Stegodyphus mimosarum]
MACRVPSETLHDRDWNGCLEEIPRTFVFQPKNNCFQYFLLENPSEHLRLVQEV